MGQSRFQKKVEKELPIWQQHGWVSKEGSEAILKHLSENDRQFNLLTLGIAILGVLLLGSGIITYFAANWAEMTKITKLILLFSAMYIAFLAAGHFLKDHQSPLLGHALLVLGVIIFGANIMLIAQIYHIDEHYPNGVLFWSIGGLITAYLFQSHAVFSFSIALSALWTSLETFGFNQIHFWYLALWACFLPIIYYKKWAFALHLALIALLLWSVYSFVNFNIINRSNQEIYLAQIYFLIYLSIFLMGMLCATSSHLSFFSKPLQNYSAFAALSSFYLLTFPDIQRGARYFQETTRLEASNLWLIITFVALIVLVSLSIWHRSRTKQNIRPRYLVYGQILIAGVVFCIVLNLFLAGQHGSLMAILLNVLFFAGMVWLLFAGSDSNNRTLINLAFIFFALALITRYFDTFWSLLNRSFFFMAGGLILIIGGYFLEKQRRKFTSAVIEND